MEKAVEAPRTAQEPRSAETAQGLETKLKLFQMQLDGAKHERDRFAGLFEREVAWSRYLEERVAALKAFVQRAGHTAECASRKTECCPNCGDSTYDHVCELPFPCNCGLEAILAPPAPRREFP